jgi:hypothetical protein
MCVYTAHAIFAHYVSAMKNRTIWEFAEGGKKRRGNQECGYAEFLHRLQLHGKFHCAFRTSIFFKQSILSDVVIGFDLQTLKDATFDNNNIRSLELKFSSMLLVQQFSAL